MMTNKWIYKAIGAIAVGSSAACASAQSNGPLGLSARIGFFESTDSNHSGTFFAVGADYKLNALPSSIPSSGIVGYWGLSLDYYDRGSASNLPIVLNYNLRQGPIVYSLGAGIEFYDLNDYGPGSGTAFNAQLGISYDFHTPVVPLFVQAKYFFSSYSQISGLGFYVGARF